MAFHTQGPHGFDPGLHPVAKISLGLNPPKKNPEEMDVFFTVMKLYTNHLKQWNGKQNYSNLVFAFRSYLFYEMKTNQMSRRKISGFGTVLTVFANPSSSGS